MSNLRFADDAVLMDEKKDSINELVRRVNTDGERRLLKINVKKTKGITIGSNTIPYEVEGRAIEEVDQFKYLSSIETIDASCTKDVKVHAAMAKAKTIELVNVWKDKSVPSES